MRPRAQTAVELQIAPLIDVCFLLLFFYLLTAAEGGPERSVASPLPGTVDLTESAGFEDVQELRISARGQVFLNGAQFDTAESRDLPQLRGMLSRYLESARANKTEARLTVCPDESVPYQRLVDVFHACIREGLPAPVLTAPETAAP
jgi:biopolymer transport protein ExbD